MSTPILPKPPAGVGGWGRILVYLVETLAQGILWQQYQYATEIASSEDPNPGTWRRFVFHWADLESQDDADDQVFTVDFVNLTNGDVDPTWTAADYADFTPALEAFVLAIASQTASRLKCDQVAAYKMAFRPYSDSKPFAESGSPEHVFPMSHFGSYSSIAPQSCSTITEITLSRAHWGRMYTPSLGAQALANTGRLSNAAVDTLVNATEAFYNTMATFDFHAVVPTTQVDKTATRTLQVVNGVRVDDVVDVHRSRRHAHALNKQTRPQ